MDKNQRWRGEIDRNRNARTGNGKAGEQTRTTHYQRELATTQKNMAVYKWELAGKTGGR